MSMTTPSSQGSTAGKATSTLVTTQPIEQTTASELVGKQPTERSEVKDATTRIVESDAQTLPGSKKSIVTLDMNKKIDDVLDVDKDTVVYLIYLLFKTNFIARNNLRNMLDEISKPLPKDVLKWLVNEAAKAGR